MLPVPSDLLLAVCLIRWGLLNGAERRLILGDILIHPAGYRLEDCRCHIHHDLLLENSLPNLQLARHILVRLRPWSSLVEDHAPSRRVNTADHARNESAVAVRAFRKLHWRDRNGWAPRILFWFL